MTAERKQAIENLKKLQAILQDEEQSHMVADDILCRLLCTLGYEDVVREYEKIDKWYA